MQRILASMTSLEQHAQALSGDSEAYRPTACPRCQRSGLWRHGFYERKADRRVGVSADESLNPVAVPRFLCPACARTCSRLPACIAPRRWYDWAVQQFVLLMLLAGCSVHRCAVCTGRERHTVRRWRDWLCERSESFALAVSRPKCNTNTNAPHLCAVPPARDDSLFCHRVHLFP